MRKVVVTIKDTDGVDVPPVRMRLSLGHDSSGQVVVRATDGNGRTWNLLVFNEDGTITRIANIPSHPGWNLDARGRIIETSGFISVNA